MPTVSLTLPDVYQTSIRPSMSQIINDICKITNLVDYNVKFTGDIHGVSPNNNYLDKVENNNPTLSSKKTIFVELEEDYNQDSITSTPVHEKEHRSIFRDTDTNVYMRPIYLMTDFNLSFKITMPSKTSAIKWRDDVRAHISRMRDTNVHSIEYNYILPDKAVEFMHIIYEYRTRLEPDLNLSEYIREKMTPQVNIISDLKGDNHKVSIHERMVRIIGLFDFSPIPEKIDKNEDDNNYSVSFNYKLTFERPAMLMVTYPVMVYNKLLPFKYLEFLDKTVNRPKAELYGNLRYSNSFNALTFFESHRELEYTKNLNHILRLPEFDEFMGYKVHPGYSPIYSALCEVNEVDKRSLFNLNDIDPYLIDDDILFFIQDSELPYMDKPYHSFFYIGLHQDKRYQDAKVLDIDSNLNIKCVEDLSLKKINRVVFSLLVDTTLMTDAMVARLRKYPKAMEKILLAINEKLRDDVAVRLYSGKSKLDLHALLNRYLRQGMGNSELEIRKNTVQFNTVMIQFIIALRVTDLTDGVTRV